MSILVIAHILCWAITFGTWFAALRTKRPSKGMAHAAGGALLFGVALMAIGIAMFPGGHLFYTLKLVFAVVVTAFSFVAINRNEQTPAVIWYGIPVAIVVNVVIAVFGIGW